jgi:hypothetical protein
MKISLDLQNTKAYDDVLSPEEFESLFDWINGIPYVWKNTTGEWNKVWSINDGEVLHSKQLVLNKKFEIEGFDPYLLPVMPFVNKIGDLIKSTGLFDMKEIYSTIITPYVYPPGTSLNWHSDSDYVGAFTFYCHNKWSANWGGEFLTVEGNEYIPQEEKENIKWKVFDNSMLEDMIMNKGTGHFIMPKPNRIVFNKSGANGILHKVNKSTNNSAERITLQGFLRKQTIKEL